MAEGRLGEYGSTGFGDGVVRNSFAHLAGAGYQPTSYEQAEADRAAARTAEDHGGGASGDDPADTDSDDDREAT
jgi:hypothetical protein